MKNHPNKAKKQVINSGRLNCFGHMWITWLNTYVNYKWV